MEQIEGWNAFINNFLQSSHILSEDQAFVVVNVSQITQRDKRTNENIKALRLTLENNKIEYILDLNKTNSIFLLEHGIKHPTGTIGKKLFFKKGILARNPDTNKEVEAIRICQIE
jgi:hypothetical protein